VKRRSVLILAGAGGVAAAAGIWLVTRRLFEFPPDTQPEGAYMRIAHNLTEGDPRIVFEYLEDPARDAVFTVHDFRKQSSALVSEHFPEPERTRLLDEYKKVSDTPDGPALFLAYAEERGWLRKLRRDLSGVAEVQVEGERATIVTARDTRYSFRKRENGLWGLTMFTPELLTESTRAARDFDVVKRAADDYANVK
jgi:hypothetical protein